MFTTPTTTHMPLPDIAAKKGRRPMPSGRVAWADLPLILGMSKSTVWRKLRPSDDSQKRAYWTKRLDVRRRDSDAALHCCARAVEELRDQLLGTAQISWQLAETNVRCVGQPL